MDCLVLRIGHYACLWPEDFMQRLTYPHQKPVGLKSGSRNAPRCDPHNIETQQSFCGIVLALGQGLGQEQLLCSALAQASGVRIQQKPL